MYHVGDKVSWERDGIRHYGFIQALINRGAYVTAMVEHHELPLEQLRKVGSDFI
ncbi:hypothetical protein IWT25_02318 [Secundilactobacillus pentosiphilus]|uniref:Uncharacterized protein n=1 Tax=Secundilactobacillus pentosiphilus TaxID=1714682 RepID=A0A1Z5IYR1_9LACO|nr:hypothetical protein [Secundilactobacillus pentosiphilus]GAX06970.1 hypothetical protein IWT25_02318 [Secundilactobacillus pentosiphilus]